MVTLFAIGNGLYTLHGRTLVKAGKRNYKESKEWTGDDGRKWVFNEQTRRWGLHPDSKKEKSVKGKQKEAPKLTPKTAVEPTAKKETNLKPKGDRSAKLKPKNKPDNDVTLNKSGLTEAHVVSAGGVTVDQVNNALDAIQTPGGAERVAKFKQFVNKHNIQAVFQSRNVSERKHRNALKKGLNAVKKGLNAVGWDGQPIKEIDKLKQIGEVKPREIGITNGFTLPEYDHIVVVLPENELMAKTPESIKDLNEIVDTTIWFSDVQGQRASSVSMLAEIIYDSPETPRYFITYLHEMGHQVHFKSGRKAISKRKEKPKSFTSYGDPSKTNDEEWFAEHFVLYMLDAERYKKADPIGAKIIEQALEKAIAGV